MFQLLFGSFRKANNPGGDMRPALVIDHVKNVIFAVILEDVLHVFEYNLFGAYSIIVLCPKSISEVVG